MSNAASGALIVECFMVGTDSETKIARRLGGQLRQNAPEDLSEVRASVDEIRSMLTWCDRSERFCDGQWGM